jgi:hypothetical protein
MLRSHCCAAARRRRSRSVRVVALFLTVTGLAAACVWSAGGALADTPQPIVRQTRAYTISIDGFRRGKSTTQFRSNGTAVWIHSESEIKINYLVYKYNYTSSGTEIWKNGRVTTFDNTADYNGTQYVVKGASTPRGLQLATNGVASLVSPDVWDTSYLLLPDRFSRIDAASVVLLDSDRGRLLTGKVQFVGDEVLSDGRIPCTHYRITGDVHVDLWYDASFRLVREDSQESGHKVRFDLVSATTE